MDVASLRKKSDDGLSSKAALETASRFRRMRRSSVNDADSWRIVNIPVGFVARRRRDSKMLCIQQREEIADKEERRPKHPPLWRFRRAARVILHLCRFCMAIARKARDMTPYSVDELLYFTARASEETNRLGFNKDDYKRDSGARLPAWAIEALKKKPEDRLATEIHHLQTLLRTVDGFRLLSTDLQKDCCCVIQYERYGPNRLIVQEGHLGNAYYIVFSGSVFVNRYEYDRTTGHRHVATVAILQKGSWFGEIALIRDCHRTASVVTREPVELLSVDKRSFRSHPTAFEMEMIQKHSFIKNIQLFSGWETEALEEILFQSHVIEYQIGKLIDKDGSRSQSLYIIMEGKCKVLRRVNIQTLKKRVLAERAQAAINSWVKTHLMPPVCTRPAGPRRRILQRGSTTSTMRSPASLTRSKSQSAGLHRRRSTFSHLSHTEEDDQEAVFVHVGSVTTKDIFDLSWLSSEGPPPTLILVSEGTKALRIPKRAFKNLLTNLTEETAKKCAISFRTDGELYDAYRTHSKWQKYRESVLSDEISSQLAKGVLRTEKTAEATLESMFRVATRRLETPRYIPVSRRQQDQRVRRSSAPGLSTARTSHLTMSTAAVSTR